MVSKAFIFPTNNSPLSLRILCDMFPIATYIRLFIVMYSHILRYPLNISLSRLTYTNSIVFHLYTHLSGQLYLLWWHLYVIYFSGLYLSYLSAISLTFMFVFRLTFVLPKSQLMLSYAPSSIIFSESHFPFCSQEGLISSDVCS